MWSLRANNLIKSPARWTALRSAQRRTLRYGWLGRARMPGQPTSPFRNDRLKMEYKATLQDWFNAPRPWSFSMPGMTAVLVFIYVFLLHRQDPITVNWLFGAISIVAVGILQGSCNLLSDYVDYKTWVDREDIYGSTHLVRKVFRPETVLAYALWLLFIGIAMGVLILSQTGLPILYIGILAFIFTVFYSYFKYRAMGELVSLITYGPLVSLGTFYAMTTYLDWTVVALSLPLTFISVTTIHANNTRDILHDRRAKITTIPTLIGAKGAILEYKIFMYGSYLLVVALVLTGMMHWITLFVMLTLPGAIRRCRIMDTATDDQPANISDLDLKSSQFQLIFSSVLCGLFLASAWL